MSAPYLSFRGPRAARSLCRTFRVLSLLAVLAVLAVCALLATGCAPSGRAAPGQAVQTLPPPDVPPDNGTYAYLVYLDALRDGNGELAQKALRQAIELDPTPELYLELADLTWRMGDLNQAREVLKDALVRYPDEPTLVLNLADSYILDQRFEDAATTLRLYLQHNPTGPSAKAARLKLAQVLMDQDQAGEALTVLDAIPAAERDAETLRVTAQANTRLGNTEKAVELLEEALKLEPENILVWAELAYTYELRKDYVAAEQTYNRILELGETGEEVWLRLVRLNLELNDPDRAMALVKEGPEAARFRMEAARLFLAQGFPEQAGEILLPMADQPDPAPELYYYLALYAFEGLKDPAKALSYLDELDPSAGEMSQVLAFKAHLHYLLGHNDEALALARDGMSRYPEDPDFWEIASWVLQDTGKNDEAMQVLDEALATWPDNTRFLYRKAMLINESGDQSGALALMERVIEIDPEYPDALNFVGYTLAEQNRDLDRAEVLVKAALEQKPDSGFVMDSLAWVYFKQHRTKEAWTEIRRAVELATDDPVLWEHYGDIAAALGKSAEAAKGYRKALEFEHKDPEAVRAKLEALP